MLVEHYESDTQLLDVHPDKLLIFILSFLYSIYLFLSCFCIFLLYLYLNILFCYCFVMFLIFF